MVLMKSQHKDLMRALLAGNFDKNGAAPAAAGGSGEHPAVAAAAAAAIDAGEAMSATKPARKHAPDIRAKASPFTTAAPSKPLPHKSLEDGAGGVIFANAARHEPTTARTVAMTLDEAIRNYLEEFAATAAATVH